MGILKRLRQLLQMRLHDAITRAENPVLLVNLQVAEMQEGVERARTEIARAMAAERRLNIQAVEAHRDALRWDNRARGALTHGDDDLAREALRRRQAALEIAEYYDRAHEQQLQAVAELKATLTQLTTLLRQAKARRAALLAHHEAAEAQQAVARSLTQIVGEDSKEAFGRLAEQIETESAEAGAMLEMRAEDPEARFLALEEHDVVEDALLALKQEMGYLPAETTAGAIEQSEEAA